MLSNLVVQLINGLADACAMFLVASGLSLIFGVTRIVNFAHGSFYMLGVYVAYTITTHIGGTFGGFWVSMIAAALVVAVIGALVEVIVLRRIYQAPELFHLLATFALVLIFRDAALYIWGPQDLLGPRAPHMEGAYTILGNSLPTYDIALIIIGPVVLLASPNLFPVARGVYTFYSSNQSAYTLLAAAVMIVSLPVALLFVVSQRQLLRATMGLR